MLTSPVRTQRFAESKQEDKRVKLLDTVLLTAPIAIAATYITYRALARRPDKFRLSDYFLARGDIGPRVTTANSLNNNFALANILWLFVVWSYFFGPVNAVLMEIPWCIALYFVGRIAPVILESARAGRTLHGFLGHSYGSERLRTVAAFVTSFGYLLNFGFEVYVSSVIIVGALGSDPELKWLVAIVLSLTTATYISIAGFLGNVSQDRTQNRIGVFGALLFAAIVTGVVLLSDPAPGGFTLTNFLAFDVSWPVLLGILAYTSVFNLVDVSNWQGVGANKALPAERSKPEQRLSWRNAAVGAWLFSCIGAWLGYLLRSQADLQSNELFPFLFDVFFLPDAAPVLRTALLGLVVGGFFVLALGYAENLLSAAQLTIMADVAKKREYDKLVSEEEDSPELAERENTFVEKCQRSTFALVIAALALFYLVFVTIDNEQRLLDFMFIIFGSAVGMFPALIHAVRLRLKGKPVPGSKFAWAAGISVLVGYAISISPLFLPKIPTRVPLFGGVSTAEVSAFFALLFSFVVFHTLRRIADRKSS